MPRLLIVDDEPSVLSVMTSVLKSGGYFAQPAQGAEKALQMLEQQAYDLIISDLRMQPIDGMQFMQQVRNDYPDTVFIMMSAYGTVEIAVEAMKEGAFSYITKPFKMDELLISVERALGYKQLRRENQELKDRLAVRSGSNRVVAQSPAMCGVCETIEALASSQNPILFVGEKGSGKTRMAQALHELGYRRDYPFSVLPCASLTPSILEVKLFGSKNDDRGFLANDAAGSLYLKDADMLPVPLQSKIAEYINNDLTGVEKIRVLAGTSGEPSLLLESGAFDEHLFEIIAANQIEIPALRNRKEDVLPLAYLFLAANNTAGQSEYKLDADAEDLLEAYSWPENVRELEYAIQHAVEVCDGFVVHAADLPPKIHRASKVEWHEPIGNDDIVNLKAYLRRCEKNYILHVLNLVHNDKEKAAKLLGVSLATFYRKLPEPE